MIGKDKRSVSFVKQDDNDEDDNHEDYFRQLHQVFYPERVGLREFNNLASSSSVGISISRTSASVPSSSGAGGSGLKRSYCCVQQSSDDSTHDEAGGPSKEFVSKLVEMMNNPELSDEEIEAKNEAYSQLQTTQRKIAALRGDIDDESSIDSSSTNISNTSDASNSTLNSAEVTKLCRRLNNVDLSKLAYCPLCKKSAPKKSKRKDKELRDFIMESTLLDLTNSSCKGVGKADKSVNAKCCTQTGGNCVSRVQVGHVGDLRKRFWGDSSIDDFLNSKVRGEKLKKLPTEYGTFITAPIPSL
jgi:hypothetical protein